MKISQQKKLTAIGLMSGTSFDGVDAALIKSDGEHYFKLNKGITIPYSKKLIERLKVASTLGVKEILELEDDLTRIHIQAVKDLLAREQVSAQNIDLLGFHGQTIIHIPERHLTWQIGNSSLLAHETKINVVSDFRRRDIAAKGQGAPLVPIFHQALSTRLTLPVVFLNIGGVANITYIDDRNLIAFDVGAGNAPSNDFIHKRLGLQYDKEGVLAKKGRVDTEVIDKFFTDAFFSQKPPKSLDRNAFSYAFLETMSTEDGLATLGAIVATAVEKALAFLPKQPREIIVCGGGRKNAYMISELKQKTGVLVQSMEESLNIDGGFVEAYAFGYLAIRSYKKLPISFPATTLAPYPLIGGVFCPA